MPPQPALVAGAPARDVGLNSENVMTKFRGSFDKWVKKATELDKEQLTTKLRTVEPRNFRKVLHGQINIWYVLAMRNKARADKPPLPPPVRAKIVEFIGDASASSLLPSCKQMQQLGCSVVEQYYARSVLPYFLDKIHASVEKGNMESFEIDRDLLDGAPALANGERPRIEVVVRLLVFQGFRLRMEGHEVAIDRSNSYLIDTVPLPVRVLVYHWSHTEMPAQIIAAHAARNLTPGGAASADAPAGRTGKIWVEFQETIGRIGDEVVKYLLDLFSAAVAKGIPQLEITRELLDQGPKLPSGESYPVNARDVDALHDGLSHGYSLLSKLSKEQPTMGFTIKGPFGLLFQNRDPLPVCLHAMYVPEESAVPAK
ncbi:unnamed protein product [Amoebophrya sp. A120]|nr:unnamed protein product [Amoebophrya sp. A120]|eukprot:GSA120T00012925001.1